MLYLKRVSTTGKHKVFLLHINILLPVSPVCGWEGSRGLGPCFSAAWCWGRWEAFGKGCFDLKSLRV